MNDKMLKDYHVIEAIVCIVLIMAVILACVGIDNFRKEKDEHRIRKDVACIQLILDNGIYDAYDAMQKTNFVNYVSSVNTELEELHKKNRLMDIDIIKFKKSNWHS